jgi:hypothetical protein
MDATQTKRQATLEELYDNRWCCHQEIKRAERRHERENAAGWKREMAAVQAAIMKLTDGRGW